MAYSSRTLRNIVEFEIFSRFVWGNNPDENFTVPATLEGISLEDQNLLLAIRSQIATEESDNFLANIDVITEVVKHVNVTGEILNYLIEEVHNRIDPEDPQRGHKIVRVYEEIFLTETDNFALKIRDLKSESLTTMAKYASSYTLLSKIIAHQNSNIDTFIVALENILVNRTNLLCQDLLHALWDKYSDNEEMLNDFASAIEDWNEMFLLFMNKLDPSNEMHMRVLDILRNNDVINDSASTIDAYIRQHNYARNLAAAVAGDVPLASDDDSSEVGDAPLASDTPLVAADDSSEVGDAPVASDTPLAAADDSSEAVDDDASIASEASEERIINNRVDELLNDIEIPLRLNAFEEHCRKAARNIVSLDLNIDVDFTVESEQEAEYIAEVERNHPGVLDAIVDRISLSDPVSCKNLAAANIGAANKLLLKAGII